MRGRFESSWRALFGASLLAVGIADAIVLDLTKAYFGSGYNGHALHSVGERAAFFCAGALLDVCLLALLWAFALAILRPGRTRPLVALCAAALCGLIVPLSFDIAVNRLHRVLGDVLELRLLLELAGGSWGSALAEGSQDLPPIALLTAGLLGALAALWGVTHWAERRLPRLAGIARPSARALAGLAALGVVAGGGLLAATSMLAPAIHFGLELKPAGRIGTWLLDELSDFDRDGVGLLSRPRDPAAFDASIQPFAIEIPGNGIDENGFAGDLPDGFADPTREYPRLSAVAPAPHSFVLIFLESFRGDLLGARFDGREVTPNLNRLAREGASATAAYAHSPATRASRAQLMQGRVYPTPDGSTLVDDFVGQGYDVGWFSGQHDEVGPGELRLGTELASVFYDANQDIPRRTSRSAQPISLQVSWRTVLERVSVQLAARGGEARPLLLYVNVVDTHFPYWHREMEDLLGVGALPRERIRPENRAEVWRAYLNAAANVDFAVGELIALAERALGEDIAILVTGDHGQAFYESGLLGHGQALDDAQTRVPLISRGVVDAWPPLIGLADVRQRVRESLGAAASEAGEPAAPRIPQILGDLNRPVAVGLRDAAGATVTDLATSRVERLFADGSREPLPSAAGLPGLRAWEQLRAASAH